MQLRGWLASMIGIVSTAGSFAAQAAETEQATPSAAPTALPGKGLVQHPFLYCGEWQQRGKSEQTVYIVRGGKVVWTYSIPSKEELGVQVIEVTPDKKVVWALRDWETLGPASSIQLLDEPGVPEKGDLQR